MSVNKRFICLVLLFIVLFSLYKKFFADKFRNEPVDREQLT